MRWRASILRAPRLGQCGFYGIQLLTGCFHLDSQQRCIGAVAGFLRQKARSGESSSALPHPTPPHPRQEMLGLKGICERLMALLGLLEPSLMTLQSWRHRIHVT